MTPVPLWDRNAKAAAFVVLTYLTLLAAAWCLWQAGRVVARSVGDAPQTHPQPRSGSFQPTPASPYGWPSKALDSGPPCVRDGGHK